MIKDNSHSKFANLTFDDFRKLASDPTLSRHEKVGFPDSYRQDKEDEIFSDMCGKVTNLSLPGKTVLEIGPSCSELPVLLAQRCETNGSQLIFVDSEEMLALRPNQSGAQLVQHLEGSLVARQPQLPMELHSRHTGRLGRHQIGTPEPDRQRHPTLVHDGSRRERSIGSAVTAAEHHRLACGKPVGYIRSATLRTGKPVRPAQMLQIAGTRSITGNACWNSGSEVGNPRSSIRPD